MAKMFLTKEEVQEEDNLFEFIRTLDQKAKEDFEIFIKGYILGKSTA